MAKQGVIMAEKCKCGCAFGWLSGFFAMPAIVHLIRALAGWEVTFKGNPVAIKTSWMVFVIAAVLSVIFCILGCRKHKDDAPTSSCCS